MARFHAAELRDHAHAECGDSARAALVGRAVTTPTSLKLRSACEGYAGTAHLKLLLVFEKRPSGQACGFFAKMHGAYVPLKVALAEELGARGQALPFPRDGARVLCEVASLTEALVALRAPPPSGFFCFCAGCLCFFLVSLRHPSCLHKLPACKMTGLWMETRSLSV